MKPKESRRWMGAAISAAVLAAGASALAEDVFVTQPSVVVRAGKGAVYEEVANVRKGDKLTVLGREGKWLKVQAGGRQGYVFETAVAAQNPGGAGGGLSGLSKFMGAGSGTGTASDTAAGRGLGESLAWARSSGMDPSGLDKMIAARKRVTPGEWETFVEQGKVGPAKQ